MVFGVLSTVILKLVGHYKSNLICESSLIAGKSLIRDNQQRNVLFNQKKNRGLTTPQQSLNV